MLIHKLLYISTYVTVPVVLVLLFIIQKKWPYIKKNKLRTGVASIVIIGSVLFLYARFIEPNIIIVRNSTVDVGFTGRVVVIADMHLGVYRDEHFMRRVVERINKLEDIDAVLIPGDFTYYPGDRMEALFAALADLRFPTYAVLGNHDSEMPGPPVRVELQQVLERNGVQFLHNTSVQMGATDIQVLGLGDLWVDESEFGLIEEFSEADKLIVLVHNPDAVFEYSSNTADLTVSGHTHGGQIRIPWLYKKVLVAVPSKYGFDRGLYQTENGQVFVTSGLGIVGLPFRLGVPPTIDVLELR